ncbi:hypothetical protein GCM10023084_18150 [Streptomyces lacrimifluminis]|uniref:Uncharacterized protein n=1 Tax=Streptomyces lacrimifluminis TaxID=1500077 RepID=A0A917NLD3_9ACTN|nr:hypothetical protein GCM10012282_02520 [Streptomyces lacrimifluminis]
MRPFRPPVELIQRAYACAMAGMPGLLVASVPSGAQVMTVTSPPSESAEVPGTTPQPAASAAHTVSALRDLARVDLGRLVRKVLRVRRLPVMDMHDSVTRPTRM